MSHPPELRFREDGRRLSEEQQTTGKEGHLGNRVQGGC